MSSATLPRVGFVGIGKMGLPMAKRVAAGGYPVHAYDTSAAALREVCAQAGVQCPRLMHFARPS